MNRPFQKATIYYNRIIPLKKTRFPWFHKNFSGIPGWKQQFIKKLEDKMELEECQRGSTKILFKAFGRIVMLDSGRTELWHMPKFTTTNGYIRFGWLYWAIEILRGNIYFIPDEIEAQYKFLADEDNLHIVLQQGMNTGNPELIMDAMNIMLQLDYSNFRIQLRVVSKTGDRIQYTVTYPRVRVIINSVNGIQNHAISAKYRQILSSENVEDRERQLIHKDDMTPDQLKWLQEVD